MVGLNASLRHSDENQTMEAFGDCSGPMPTKTVKIAVYSVVMFLSLIGNTLVVAVVYRNKELRTTVNYFIANMAISDLIFPLIVMPWKISAVYSDFVWLVDGTLGSLFCKFVFLARSVSSTVSILSMVAIAVDRFHAIVFAMKPTLISRKTCAIIAFLTWVVAILFRAHYLYGFTLVHDGTGLYCVLQWEPPSYTNYVLKINWITFMCLTSTSAVTLTVLYSVIVMSLYRQKTGGYMAVETKKLRASEDQRATCMLVIVVLIFYVVWVAYLVADQHLALRTKAPCLVYFIGHLAPNLYPVINPAVYYLFNEKYRQAFRELLHCAWLHNKIFNLQPGIIQQLKEQYRQLKEQCLKCRTI